MKKIFNIMLFLVILLIGCDKSNEYPPAPEIKFLSFEVIEGDGESTTYEGILKFSFIDGDGDIGFLENSDTIAENNITDVLIKEYYKKDGEYLVKPGDPYLLPYFEEGIYRKHLKGEIEIKLPRIILNPDTVRYEFYIFDRSKHESNIEVTPVIIYSELIKQ